MKDTQGGRRRKKVVVNFGGFTPFINVIFPDRIEPATAAVEREY